MNKVKKIFFLVFVAGLTLSAFSTYPSPPAFEDNEFVTWFETIPTKIQKTGHRLLPLETVEEEKALQTIDLIFSAYHKQIGETQFIQALTEMYPDYSETVEWLASQLPA